MNTMRYQKNSIHHWIGCIGSKRELVKKLPTTEQKKKLVTNKLKQHFINYLEANNNKAPTKNCSDYNLRNILRRGLGKSTTHTTTKNTIAKNPSKIRRAKFRKNTKNQKYDEIRSKIRFLILSPCYLFAHLKRK